MDSRRDGGWWFRCRPGLEVFVPPRVQIGGREAERSYTVLAARTAANTWTITVAPTSLAAGSDTDMAELSRGREIVSLSRDGLARRHPDHQLRPFAAHGLHPRPERRRLAIAHVDRRPPCAWVGYGSMIPAKSAMR